MNKLISTISFISSAVALVCLFSIDACLDAGGIWSNLGFTCSGVDLDFTPQYQRISPAFWTLVFALSSVVGFSVNKILILLRR